MITHKEYFADDLSDILRLLNEHEEGVKFLKNLLYMIFQKKISRIGLTVFLEPFPMKLNLHLRI